MYMLNLNDSDKYFITRVLHQQYERVPIPIYPCQYLVLSVIFGLAILLIFLSHCGFHLHYPD